MTSEWKPIETAPKDGTRILIYEPMPADPRGWFDVVHWGYSGRHHNEGWVDSEGAASCDGTHWMPLPEPPHPVPVPM